VLLPSLSLESRNIGKFTREWQQLRKKFRGQADPQAAAAKAKTSAYDEDQAL
jgi:hypothetical protein